jgi:hypothetical protein
MHFNHKDHYQPERKDLSHLHNPKPRGPKQQMMTIEEAKLEARKEIEFSDLLNRDGIRALKDGLDSDKYALLENLIAEL